MADRFYLILEILAVLLCLHGLYGEKFKWNIYTVLFIAVEFIAYQIEDVYAPVKHWEIFLYIILFIYSLMQFKYTIRECVINYMLCLVLTTVMQLVCYFPIMVWNDILSDKPEYVINSLLLIAVLILYKHRILYKISLYMLQKGKMVIAFLIVSALFMLYTFLSLKIIQKLSIFNYSLIIVSIFLLMILILQLQKTKLINRQMASEINLNNLYGNAFKELIDKIRMIQHNYKNELTTLQGMIYTANSLEELKAEQRKFNENNKQEDRYYKILAGSNNPLLAGFLYAKLSNINQENIIVNYEIHITNIHNNLIIKDLIEIAGVLIDNAIEEVEKDWYNYKCIEIKIEHSNGYINIEVGNICRFIKYDEMCKFFKKGNSSKGENRGIGLYRVKKIVEELNGEIIPVNRSKNEENWFYISIKIPNKKGCS